MVAKTPVWGLETRQHQLTIALTIEHSLQEFRFSKRKVIYSRCCLAMGNCECSLSRPLRPASYASLPKEFVTGCVDNESSFGRNFEKVLLIDVGDLELIWSYDKQCHLKPNIAEDIAAHWVPMRRAGVCVCIHIYYIAEDTAYWARVLDVRRALHVYMHTHIHTYTRIHTCILRTYIRTHIHTYICKYIPDACAAETSLSTSMCLGSI
jgi:hypothetical protein